MIFNYLLLVFEKYIDKLISINKFLSEGYIVSKSFYHMVTPLDSQNSVSSTFAPKVIMCRFAKISFLQFKLKVTTP
jgi:hypothetical protein